jgi:hypothetical protein
MKRTVLRLAGVLVLVAGGLALADLAADAQPPFGQKGKKGDPTFMADHQTFHFLLAHRGDIRREVRNTARGVETLTESDDPKVSAKIQEHVAAMYDRVKQGRGIHLRDPLFAEVFRNAGKIKMTFEKTPRGMRVTETSEDPYVARLIQAHAEVVNQFIKNGHWEMKKNHTLPAREQKP